MKLTRQLQHKILTNEFLTFRSGFLIADFLMWNFYQIFLYKKTESLTILVVEILIFFISLWVGFMIMGIALDSIGYLKSMRFMYFSYLIPIILLVLYMDNIESIFITIAVLRGIPQGFYWSIHHSFFLRELHGNERSQFINVSKSLELILGIVIPVLAGSLISSTDGYEFVFLLGALMYIALLVFPWKYNKIPQSKVTVGEVTRIINSHNFNNYALLRIFDAGINGMFILMFSIIPFLFIGDEFGVGAYMSFVAFIAACTSFFERKKSFKFRIELGLLGHFIRSLVNILFALLWTFPLMIIRSMIIVVTVSTSDTVEEDLINKNKELLLRDFRNESAAEINLVDETLLLIGRICAFIPIIIILINTSDPETLFRLFIGVFAFYKLITLYFQAKLHDTLKM